MEQVSIKIDEIKINPGRREADASVVKTLAESMSALSLLTPIIVDTEHTLDGRKSQPLSEISPNFKPS